MRILVVLALAWCCGGQVAIPYINVVPEDAEAYPWGIQYHSTDALGQKTFGYHANDQTRHEVRLADGRVIGQFSYVDPNGEPAVTYFQAGTMGYQVVGSNILPEAPIADLVAPEPVLYTAEVAEARAEFLKLYNKAATGPSAVHLVPEPVNDLVAPKPVGYTPEVAQARAEFMKIFNERVAAHAASEAETY